MKRLAFVLFALILSGCATTKHVEGTSVRSVTSRIDPGEVIEVVTTDRKFWRIAVQSADDEKIVGLSDGELVEIQVSQIDELRYRGISVGKTVGFGFVTYLLLLVGGLALLVAGL